MARRYPYGMTRQELYRPADGPPFFQDWDPAHDTANRELLAAEFARLAYAEIAQVRSSLATIGFALECWIGGETLEERRETRGTDGFIATSASGDLTVLAFRGTEANKPEDMVADAFADPVEWESGGRVHHGFKSAYDAVRGKVRGNLPERGG